MEHIRTVADLGAVIRHERRRQGFSQTQLADGSGVGITYVFNLENGKETSEMGKAIRVAESLGIDLFAEARA
ncbi:MAG: helix-turn-helix domain-containing protein [Atopobiaceae bacterium]|jgi:transcriptional regulator with XRE-family HTH domain|nr:helix-turn-helix domain-containing protein [Atopobiaceae bacterium]